MKRSTARLRALWAAALSALVIGSLFPAAPAVAAPAVKLLNPSDYSPTLRISDKEDDDDTYHLVAWVREVPPAPVVEFELATPATGLATVTGTQVATDTWAAELDVPDELPDGQYLLRAILYSGQDDQATDTQTVTVQSNPTLAPAETVEMTYPAPGAGMGFFTPPGGRAVGALEGVTSEGVVRVRALYTFSEPGTDPEWHQCGSGTPDDDNVVRARCTLQDDGPAARVRAVALVANNTPPPGEAVAAGDETGDAHRVIPYTQIPTTLQFDPESARVDPDECRVMDVKVLDQGTQEIIGVNVDVHATGPDDQLRFATIRNTTDPFQAPDKGHPGTEPTVKCSPTDPDGTEGEHNVPANPDQKHIESTSGTGTDGAFTFALRSGVKGGTLIEAWADVDGDDVQAVSEASAGAQLGWGVSPPEPEKSVLLDPQFASPARGSCQSFTVAVKQGGEPLSGRNVDIHIKDPANVAFCAPEGNGTRPPDTGDHSGGEHEEDGTLHAEGETDATGKLVFGVTSPDEGVTTVRAWADEDDDDEEDSGESNTSGQISWGGETRRLSTGVSIRYRRSRWSGALRSSDGRCRSDRTVVLKKVKRGRDQTVGSDTSGNDGSWSIRRRVRRGRYYAIAQPKRFVDAGGDTIICKRGRSKTKRP